MDSTYRIPSNKFYQLLGSFSAETRGKITDYIDKKLGKIDKEATWPDVPYDYTQGRIMAYDIWLGSLSEKERVDEIEACRSRYAAKFQSRLEVANEFIRENKFAAARPQFTKPRDRGDDFDMER